MSFFEELAAYCQQNGRVCPQPQSWNHLYSLLSNKVQKPSGGWTPPLPLILAAWHEASDHEKQARLMEHLSWADAHGDLERIDRFVRSLPEEKWFHGND